jgi:hypothetical protein
MIKIIDSENIYTKKTWDINQLKRKIHQRNIGGLRQMKKDKITKEKIEKYYSITKKALGIVKKSISQNREKEAKEIIQMVECYLSDSKHFEKNEDYTNSFGAIYYAHGWLDCGARLKIFNVKDNKLFTV